MTEAVSESVAAPSETSSADEGATVVESPTAANASTQSSPTTKKEKL
jgi:hypothetical protein